MTWDPPPPRSVVGPDGGVGSGGTDPGGSGTYGNMKVCTKQDQPNCCYDGKNLSGIPMCGWRRISAGATAQITTTYKENEKVTLSTPLQLSTEVPDSFATYDDCVKVPVGFVLSGAALKERVLGSSIEHYMLLPDGTWHGQGGGATSGLVVAKDTQVTTRDGGQPEPTYELMAGLCDAFTDAKINAVALIQFFDQVDFTVDGVDYSANFRSNPSEGGATGYYILIEKGF